MKDSRWEDSHRRVFGEWPRDGRIEKNYGGAGKGPSEARNRGEKGGLADPVSYFSIGGESS